MSDRDSLQHVASLLPGLVAGTLTPANHRATLLHLAGCPACRAELAAWEAVGDATRAVYHDSSVERDDALRAVWQHIEAGHTETRSARGLAPQRPGTPHPAAVPLPPPVAPPPQAGWMPPPRAPRRGRPVPLLAATALLVLAALVVNVLTLGQGGRDLGGLIVLPAISTPEGSPVPDEPRDRGTVEVVLPEALLVRGEGLGFGLSHDVIPADSESNSAGGYLRIEHVLQGTVYVRSGGATQVVWAAGDGAAEPVLSGTEVLLGPGDTLIAPRASSTTYRNTGATLVDLVTWGMSVNPESQGNQTPLEWRSYDLDLRPGSSLPPGPVRWRMRQVDLAPGAELVAPTGALHQFAVSVPPDGSGSGPASTISREGEGTVVNVGRDTATVYVVTLEPELPATPSPASPAAPGGE